MNWIAELTVKFDILGLKTLTVLNDAKNLLKETKGLDINFDDIDLSDDFIYNSGTNKIFMKSNELKALIKSIR